MRDFRDELLLDRLPENRLEVEAGVLDAPRRQLLRQIVQVCLQYYLVDLCQGQIAK